MACKLSRRKKSKTNKILKLLRELNLSSHRSYDSMVSNYINIRIDKNDGSLEKAKLKSYDDYDNVDFFCGTDYMSIRHINYNMVMIVPVVISSTVKRSRIKNVSTTFLVMKIDEYNQNTNRQMNPVSMYHYIKSKEERNGL